jgi:hypothetical protein
MLGPFTSSVGRVLPVLFARRIQTLATTYRANFGADEILASDRQIACYRKNRYMDVWRKNNEGTWKSLMYIDNPDVPDPFRPESI